MLTIFIVPGAMIRAVQKLLPLFLERRKIKRGGTRLDSYLFLSFPLSLFAADKNYHPDSLINRLRCFEQQVLISLRTELPLFLFSFSRYC